MREMTLSRLLVVGALWLFVGCDSGDEPPDGHDAAVRDAQADGVGHDAGVDAAAADAGLDAMLRDAQVDAAAVDAGLDAALLDTGVGTTDDDSGTDADVVDACDAPVTCPSAAVGKVTVCGRLYDVETDAEIRAATPLALSFYDALDFAANPAGATSLAVQALQIDDCGRYVAENIALPGNGFLGLIVDDAVAAPDDHRATAAAIAVSSGQVHASQRAYVIRRSTDVQWSVDVGFGANTFVDRGVLMAIFFYGTAPVAGVTVTSDGLVRAADDYYFSDADPALRSTVVTGGPTQANGAALLLNSSLVQHSGQGAEPLGCVWPSNIGASVPGVLWVLPRVAQLSGGGECP